MNRGIGFQLEEKVSHNSVNGISFCVDFSVQENVCIFMHLVIFIYLYNF